MEGSGVNGQYYWKDSSLDNSTITGIYVIGLIGIFFYGSYSELGSSL